MLEIRKKIKTEKDLEHSYNQIYNKGTFIAGKDYFLKMIKFLKIKKNKSKKLLDIGCGDGRFFKYLKKYIQIYGIDLSKNAIKKAKKNFSYANIILGSAEKLPFENKSFDYITYLGTLEHFISMEKSLKESKRVLKDDGKCLVLVPNLFFIDNIISVIINGKINTMQELDRFGTYNEWKNLFKKNGFQVVKSYKYNLWMSLKYFNWKWPLKIIYNLFKPLMPFHLSWHFVYILKKS